MNRKSASTPPKPCPELRAADAQSAAGISHRQLNDWDSKGAVPGERKSEREWRRFTPREFFALMVCGALRTQFGVPIGQLKYVRTVMLKEGSNHLFEAIRMMRLGLAVWLLTDCRSTFIMNHDLEFADLFRHGGFRGEITGGFMLVRIDPIVRRLVAALKTPIDLTPTTNVYNQAAKIRAELWANAASAASAKEILRLVEDPTNEAVNFNLKDGEIVRATARKRTIRGSDREVSEAEVLRMLRGDQFQTVTLKKHGGKIVAVEQTIPIPMQEPSDTRPSGRPASTPRKPSDRRGRDRGDKRT